MFKYKLRYFLIIFFLFISSFSFSPKVVKAASCYIDNFYVTSGLSVQATWIIGYGLTPNTYYAVFFSWDNGPAFEVGRETGSFDDYIAGGETTTFSSYGWHTATIQSTMCTEEVSLYIPPPPSNPLGTICVASNVSTNWILYGPNANYSYEGSPGDCRDDVTGSWSVGNVPPISGYSGPSISPNGSQTVSDGGQIGWDITYTANPTGRWKCLATNQCGWDSNDSGPNQCSTNADCVASNTAPNPPTISGLTSGYTGTSYAYSFAGTDPDGNQVRYGVDWSVPSDGVVDEWVPSSGLVNSGTSRGTSHSWSTTGIKTIKAITQDSVGADSAWSGPYNVTISTPPTNISGVCGTANKVYASTDTPYGSDTFCSSGTTSPSSPVVPTAGNPTTWSCLGSGTGTSASCTASISGSGYSVTVVPPTGGSVKSNDAISPINCGTILCTKTYPQNTSVTLQAYPASSYWKFAGWGGDGSCTGTGLCNLIVNSSKTVTASFVLRSFNYREF